MDFFIAVRVLLRRWRLVVATLAVGFAVAFAVMQSVAPTYEARGSVLLFAPSASDDEEEPAEANPFRSFDASTAVLAAVIAQIMDDASVREQVAELGGEPDYQIGQATDGTPVLTAIATDEDESVAIRTVLAVQETIDAELEERQSAAGAPEEARIRAIVITEPTNASELIGGRIRAFAAVAAITVAGALSLAFVVENISHARATGEAPERSVPADGPPANGSTSAAAHTSKVGVDAE